MNRIWLAAVAVAVLVTAGAGAFALDAAECRKICKANEDAVVILQLVLETTSSYEGTSEKEQQKITATGTVLDPSGLVVASLTEVNPSEMYNRFYEEDSEFQTSSKVVDAKIRLADGTEIPADFVLRDQDLDLAFLKPKKPVTKPLAYINLADSQSPDLLDELIVLCRLGTSAGKLVGATVDRVRAVITKPRTFYVLNSSVHSSVGGPAFTPEGKLAGITLIRYAASKSFDRGSRGGMDEVMSLVVLPCSTLSTIAEQAKKAGPIQETAAPDTSGKPAAKPPVEKPKP